MSEFRQKLYQLLNTLPAILLVTFIEVIICFATATLIMLELMPKLGSQHPHVVLGIAIMTAVATHFWIIFNHKIRTYIKTRSSQNE